MLIMMTPFAAGIGPNEITDVANVLDLPNANNLDPTITRHQLEIAHELSKYQKQK